MKRLILMLGLLGQPVGAQDGNFLFDQCNSRAMDAKSLCAGYVGGVWGAAKFIDEYPFCAPNGVTYPQITDVVTDYLRRNPAKRHILAPELALQAFQSAFPCE